MVRNVVSDEEEDVELDEEENEPADAVEDDEEEDDEEGQDEYEKDDFIVDDVEEDEQEPEEEGRADSDEERQRKKKRKKKRRDTKKFKRLKKARRDADDDGDGVFAEGDGSGKGGREEKLSRTLFDDDEGQRFEDVAEEEEQIEEEEEVEVGEDDDMADFIVEEEELDEHGVPVRHKKVKKKKSRQASGASSSALQEAHEIFGDVDELIKLRKQQGLDSNNEWRERRLEDEFEPSVLSEKYMTQKDEQVRLSDIPERMQISEESTGSPPTDEVLIDDESTWIYNQLASGATSLLGVTVNKDDIVQFLELHHVQKLDVPFIATYRKEDCFSLLKDPGQLENDYDNQDNDQSPKLKWHKVLWAIQDLDRKWLLLQKRKSALHLYYEKRFDEESRRIYDETRLNLNHHLFKSIIKALEAAESEREVDDVDAKFNLHFPPGEVGVDEGQYKRPKRRSQYSICNKAGLWEVASKFGPSAEQLGLTLSLLAMSSALEDPKETPEEMASNFTCAMFETPQAVLKGARHMAAVEISCEPYVRKHIRGVYMEHAVISTAPTPDGNTTIDSFHQFYGVKWLREKPISEFKDAQWLLIQKAEEEKLLQVTVKLPEKRMELLVNECKDHYCSDGVSKSAQLWNEQRQLIVQDALFGFLLPSMEKEARSLLTSKSKRWLLWEYGQGLWNKVSVGPYQRKESDPSSDDDAAPRVMACCWGPGKPATTFVMLDSSGEVLDVLSTGSLTLRSQNVDDVQRKKNDQQRVLRFMMDHQPHVVILGAVNLSCTRLKEDIYEIIFKMVEENPRDVGHDMDELSIVYGDESLARLYENSRISSDQLPSQPGIVKRAVALGRHLQNPLAMVATLCGPEREILSWKLNPLESFLTPDEKYTMVEQVLVDVTSQVGVDINLAISHEWLFGPLQFISGLGPRKAASLQRSLVRAGAIFTRKDFVTTHSLGKKVFVNAVGFLRVRRSGLAGSSSQFIDLLDDTRIHPESYGLAQEMAKDIYEMDNGEANDDDDLEMAIEHVREHPTRLKILNLDKYLKDKKRENKKETFRDIKRELIQGFMDWRKRYKEPTQEEEFYMISGETVETLAEGRIVQATVRRVLPGKAICVLESGLTGILTREDYADDYRDIHELSERVHEGDVLTCRIKAIDMNRYQANVACKESELRNNRLSQQVQDLDPYYHEDTVNLQSDQDKARKEKELAKKHFKPRMIVHPRFQNITADEAMEFLSDKEPGESIIRPSSRGPSFLTLTLKVYNGVYAHKDIVEGGKELKDITSLLRIGKTLKIGEDTFEDLDEVIDRYVDPLVVHLKSMLNYRKFRRGTKAEVDELLKIEKSEYPMRIVYSFGISHEHPGTFILTYIRSTNPHHEYVGLYPKGFKFRKRMFEDIDRLIAYFQRHIDDQLHESGPSIRSVAAMVPMRSPAGGGSSGDGGGWGGSGSNNDGGGWKGGDRSSGRNDYRNGGGGGRGGGHESGVPRPYGGRGGRGRGRNNDRQDSGYDRPKWDSGGRGGGNNNDTSSWGSFAGNRAQNSPTRESGGGGGVGWSSGGGGGGGSSSWGGGGNSARDSSGWGGATGGGGGDDGNSGWASSSRVGSAQPQSDSGWGSGGGSGW
ncbi:unnamed protein product [Linum tenue]|uniref:Transcription elongation factor spt6 n=1 Tax=Linum tenue TaxID=586396 RepID=A0AAV0H8J7_9ROSI|nr:unnamed protein product [Linum tenue]